MSTGSLRARLIAVSLALLAAVLVVVVTAVTLSYRASLRHDLRGRLLAAADAMQRNWPSGQGKALVPGFALEGVAVQIRGPRLPLPAGVAAAGGEQAAQQAEVGHDKSLLVLRQRLADGTRITYSASERPVERSVTRLLEIEVGVSIGALALAALLTLYGASTALRPLAEVARTAREIAAGDRSRRLRPDRTGTELGGMAAAFDQMVDALEAAIARAEQAEAAMRGFLADASHELRTPIAGLQATVETLLREQPGRPERDAIEADLVREASRLGRLVDDLLALARLESEEPPRTPVDLSAVAAELVEDERWSCGVPVLSASSREPCPVLGDHSALVRVLRNLVENAAASGATRIEVSTVRVNGRCELTVADDGCGIDPEDRERIFDRFARLDHGRPGHGLGLPIARRIAHQHGGTLTCDETSPGASFTLRLPAA